MRKIILVSSLLLSACSYGSVASTGAAVADAAGVPAPVATANRTTLDEQAVLGVELAYKAARMAMETAVDAGLLKGASAARAKQLDNEAYLAVTLTRSAYATGNADSYSAAVASARGTIEQFLALVKGK